jgi:hypothetical protein
MKILINKKQLLKSIIYVIDNPGSDNEYLTIEDAINFIAKMEGIVTKLPNNLTLGTISKVMEEALSENNS